MRTFAAGFSYCNGIAFDRDGTVVVVERRGLHRVHDDGEREWVIETLGPGGGDGFCFDADGRYYVASTIEHGIRVVDPDGTIVDFLEIEGKGLTTNCCFGGDDLRTLFVTDALPGNLVAFEHMPTPGLPLPAWEPGLVLVARSRTARSRAQASGSASGQPRSGRSKYSTLSRPR